MRRILSIPLIIFILFSGITVNFAAHYCGGSYVSSRVSFSGSSAGCGMQQQSADNQEHVIKNHCCENVLSSCAFSTNYLSPSFNFRDAGGKLVQLLSQDGMKSKEANSLVLVLPERLRPPGNSLPNMVILEKICIYRI